MDGRSIPMGWVFIEATAGLTPPFGGVAAKDRQYDLCRRCGPRVDQVLEQAVASILPASTDSP